jgi:hypothetical protein
MCESHGKGRVDTLFALLNRWRFLASQTSTLSTIEQVAAVLNKHAALELQANHEMVPIKVVCMKPPPKWEMTWWQLKPSTMTHLLKTAYMWGFKCNDARCLSLLGRGSLSSTLTRVNGRAYTLSHMSSPQTCNFMPSVDIVVFKKEPDSIPDGKDVLVPAKLVGGWRMGYRLSSPELEGPTATINNLVTKLRKMAGVVDVAMAKRQMGDMARRTPTERLKASAVKAAAEKNRREFFADEKGMPSAPEAAPPTEPVVVLGAAPPTEPVVVLGAASTTEPVVVFGAACSSVC